MISKFVEALRVFFAGLIGHSHHHDEEHERELYDIEMADIDQQRQISRYVD